MLLCMYFLVCISGLTSCKLGLQQKSSGVVKCRKITFKLRDKKETMGENFANGTLVDDQADQEFESEQFNLRLHKEWDDRSQVSPLPEEVHFS